MNNQFAIVGQACLFPDADSPDALWQLLLDNRDCRTNLTDKDLGAPVNAYLGDKGDADRFYCTKGGFIRDFSFNSAGFSLSAEELSQLDITQQWLLTVARDALQSAGITQEQSKNTGAIIGALSFPSRKTNDLCLPLYHQLVKNTLAQTLGFDTAQKPEPLTKGRLTNASDAAANVARALGLGVHYFSLDAACASSLYAVKLACNYLASGKADVMLAGAVSGADPMFIHMGFSIFQAYPQNDISAPFNPKSQGLFAGEGAGILVIKRLADAQANQDKILGIIQSVGLSNDGRGQFVLSPNAKGQITAFERAWDHAAKQGILTEQLEVVECHATGTPLGDKVELSSMQSYFSDKTTQLPIIGSAKGNVGHLLTAAGMVSIIKTLKGMETGTLAASIGVDSDATATSFNNQVCTSNQHWPAKGNNPVAGISAFGFGGCNAHLVLTHKAVETDKEETNLLAPKTLSVTGLAVHIGSHDSLEALSQHLTTQHSGLGALPNKRWKGLEKIYQAAPAGGYIENFELDLMQLKLPANKEDQLIPQQLLLLKQADIAIRDAKLKAGSKTAVIVSMETEPGLHQYRGRVELHTLLPEYLNKLGIELNHQEYSEFEALIMDAVQGTAQLNQYTSFIGNIMASRVAALWDFSGPAFTLSAGEHGFARGIEVAHQLIMTGDADAVVLCTVDLAGSPEANLLGNNTLPPADAAAAMVLLPNIPNTHEDANTGYASLSGPIFTQTESLAHLTDTLLSQENALVSTQTLSGSGDVLSGFNISTPATQLGYSPAASGMIAAIHTLLSETETGSLITSEQDELKSVLRLSQSEQQRHKLAKRLNQGISQPKGKSLTRNFTLGGDDIADKVRQAVLTVFEHTLFEQKAPQSQVLKSTANHNQDASYTANLSLLADVHIAFLNSRHSGLTQADILLKQQISQSLKPLTLSSAEITSEPTTNLSTEPLPTKSCIWDYAQLLEYAEGSIAKVFGPEYAEIDRFNRRVRLPSRDYLLVSRVTKLDAELTGHLKAYQPSSMTTEYDIPCDAPYLVDGQIPWAVAVESGQCDLMLISYMGVDFENRGERVYRLLDCTLTFLGDLPRGGDTLRYDISINHFARNDDTLLFFFSYLCYVGETLILKMDNGCAGFFTDKELEQGKGIIRTDAEETARQNAIKSHFVPLLPCTKTQFKRQELAALLDADLESCFGSSHAGSHQNSLRFASHKFMMIEEISALNSQGGAWGLGEIVGHKFLEPDHWYFPCHFKGDQVMAGSLMAEGCGQLLQFYMLWLGMHKNMQSGRFQPLINAPQKVRCRGQVLPQSGTLTYRMEVTELSMFPTPRAKANIDILLNGKVVVDFQNLGVMLKENADCTKYKPALPFMQAPLMQQQPDLQTLPNKGVIPFAHIPAPDCPHFTNRLPNTLPFTPWHLFEFATGNIENCFGSDFAVYRNMIPPRTPCGNLQLITCVTHITGKRGNFKSPATCRTEYQVPHNAWYFKANNHSAQMPYSVLMEIALQPNGFLSTYLGTTLGYQAEPLFFRNLDGKGKLLRYVDLRGKTIVNDSTLHSTVFSGANIIQKFSFKLSIKTDNAELMPFFEGEAAFGYFNDHALTHQAGLDRGKTSEPWHVRHHQTADIKLSLNTPDAFMPPTNKPHWHLAGGQLNFVDTVSIIRKGGDNQLGYIHGERQVDSSDWFFPCHFHQDPVMPGSLGVEAMLELLQAFAIHTGLGDEFNNPRFSWPQSQIQWKYRGQISPLNKQMSVELHISAIERTPEGILLTANANLSKDKLRIYEITDLAISIVEAVN